MGITNSTVSSTSSSQSDNASDILHGIVADDRALPEPVEYMEGIASELSCTSGNCSGVGTWVTRLSVHSSHGPRADRSIEWEGSTLHSLHSADAPCDGTHVDSESCTSCMSGGDTPNVSICPEDRESSSSSDRHILAIQFVEKVEGQLKHLLMTKSFGLQSMDKLEKWIETNFKDDTRLPPGFAEDTAELLIRSKFYWAVIEAEACEKEIVKDVQLAKSHQEALQSLLKSSTLRSLGLLPNRSLALGAAQNHDTGGFAPAETLVHPPGISRKVFISVPDIRQRLLAPLPGPPP